MGFGGTNPYNNSNIACYYKQISIKVISSPIRSPHLTSYTVTIALLSLVGSD